MGQNLLRWNVIIAVTYAVFAVYILCCSADMLRIYNYSREALISLLRKCDDDHKTLRIQIQMFNKTIDPLEIGEITDSFLKTRPWWILQDEPYRWQKAEKPYLVLRLVQYSHKYRRHIRSFSKVQYSRRCHSRAIVAFSSRFQSWGVLYQKYKDASLMDVRALLVPYVYDPNTTSTMFLDEHSCPHIANKFECAFLPPTNCSLPPFTSNCTRNACMHSTLLLTNISRPFPLSSEREMKKLAATDPNKFRYLATKPTDMSATGYRGEYDGSKNYKKVVSFRPHEVLFVYGFLFRLNYNFRSLVQRRVRNFLEPHLPSDSDYNPTSHLHISSMTGPQQKKEMSPSYGDMVPSADWSAQDDHSSFTNISFSPSSSSFPPDGHCTAVHIRRTDRAVASRANISELCHIHRPHPNGTCLSPYSRTYDSVCTVWNNLGCDFGIPFGALSLRHFLNAAAVVSSSRVVFVMTDDPEWFKRHSRAYENTWSIFMLGARFDNRRNSVANGVDFLASLELARRCDGLVAHMRSAVGRILLRTMCFRHGNTTGVCPVFFDLSFPTWASPWVR